MKSVTDLYTSVTPVTKSMEGDVYGGVPIVALEGLRVRLAQLVHSLSALCGRVQAAQLPAWPALHQQFNVALVQLASLAGTLASLAPVLKQAVVYPTPDFPIQTKEWLLNTLLRKKTLPEVEEWANKGVEAATTIDQAKDDAFCGWAYERALAAATQYGDRTPVPEKKVPVGTPDKIIAYMAGRTDSFK